MALSSGYTNQHNQHCLAKLLTPRGAVLDLRDIISAAVERKKAMTLRADSKLGGLAVRSKHQSHTR